MIQPSSSEDDLDDDPGKKEKIIVTISRKNSVPSNKTESSASIPVIIFSFYSCILFLSAIFLGK